MQTLREIAPEIEATVRESYERVIDFGAHPNRASMSTSLGMNREGFWLDYVSGGSNSFALGFTIVAETSLATMLVWRAVFPELFDSLSLTRSLEKLQATVHTITPRIIQRLEASNRVEVTE